MSLCTIVVLIVKKLDAGVMYAMNARLDQTGKNGEVTGFVLRVGKHM